MGGPKGVIRPGINLAVRVARDARDGDAASPERSELSKKKRITPADAPRVGGGESASARDGGSADLDPDPEASLAKKKKKGKNKKDRQKRMMAHLSLRAEVTTPVASRDHPFEVDAADHCETPFQAYQDIEPFLFRIALALKKPKEKLRIYDPYFCEGSVVAHLARLGFTSVHNVNEDFYRNVEEGNIPEHDVLLTNPPYSGDHFRRILSFCGASTKPWLLLLPNFVCRKTYYREAVGPRANPLFLIPDPLKPYRYWAPGRKGFEERNQAKGTTPFETFWYVEMNGVASHEEVRAWWLKKFAPHSTCRLPAPEEALPQQQRLQKRPNPRARKIAAAREREAEDGRRGPGDAEGQTKTKSLGGGIYYDPERAKVAAAKAREASDDGRAGGARRRSAEERKKPRKRDRERGERTGEARRRRGGEFVD